MSQTGHPLSILSQSPAACLLNESTLSTQCSLLTRVPSLEYNLWNELEEFRVVAYCFCFSCHSNFYTNVEEWDLSWSIERPTRRAVRRNLGLTAQWDWDRDCGSKKSPRRPLKFIVIRCHVSEAAHCTGVRTSPMNMQQSRVW